MTLGFSVDELLPKARGGGVLKMGLASLADDEWLQPDPDLAAREAGVQGIYGPGSNVVECAADVLRLLGHNMPPPGEDVGDEMSEAAE